MGDSFGHIFKVTTYGESHGEGLGLILEGCPPGLTINWEDVQAELHRRRPGQSKLTTPRRESDELHLMSGVSEDGVTLGTAIGIHFKNSDVDSSKYENMRNLYRPSHAEFTYEARYGVRDWRGGGRASARETISRVAAGAVARQILQHFVPAIEIVAWVDQMAEITADVDLNEVTLAAVDASEIRCPDPNTAQRMEQRLREARKDRDTLGGVIQCIARGLPAGWGAPVFDKLDADLAKGMMSLPAAKGVEIGSGFRGVLLSGSQHNDSFIQKDGRIGTATNHSGGIQGGISNGEPVTVRVAFKPVATHFKTQKTVNTQGDTVEFAAKGRHDPCVLPRAVPIVEAMMCLVLCDHMLRTAAVLR